MNKLSFSLLLFVLCAFAVSAQTSSLEVVLFSHENNTQIPKLSKIELGVKLPNDVLVKVESFLKERPGKIERINPFVDWDLDVEAVFTHKVSGTTQQVDAFFYRDYERDFEKNTWKEKGTMHPMRIRFAAPLPGEWTCDVTMRVYGKLTGEKQTLTFTVVESNNPGYITAHANKRNLQLDNKTVFPVGINFPSPLKGVNNYHTGPNGDLFRPNETHCVTKLTEWMIYHQDIANYHDAGGRFIRTLQSGWATLLEFEKKGNYYARQPYAWEQDRLLEYCEQNGMYIYFDFMQQEPFMKYGNYDMFDWDWSHYNGDGSYFTDDAYPAYCYSDGKNKEPYEMFLEEEDLRFHEQRMRYYVSRYGYSTSIYLFELLSEPWHLNQIGSQTEPILEDTPLGDSVRKALRNYQERMAKYIKEDMGHTQHLIGVDLFNVTLYMDEKFIDKSIYSPHVDVICINPYSKSPEKFIITKNSDNNVTDPYENSMYKLVEYLHKTAYKPVLIGEGGAGDGVDDCSDYIPQQMDMMSFGFCGVAGYNSWVGWYRGQEAQFPYMVVCDEFMNEDKVLAVFTEGNGRWIQGRQAEKVYSRQQKKAKELQYYVSENGSYAAGYVKNRTLNYHTNRTATPCFDPSLEIPLDEKADILWNAGTKELVVEGLKKRKDYLIEWYDFRTGKKIFSEVQRSGRSRFILKFPELKVTDPEALRPVLWFTISEEF